MTDELKRMDLAFETEKAHNQSIIAQLNERLTEVSMVNKESINENKDFETKVRLIDDKMRNMRAMIEEVNLNTT